MALCRKTGVIFKASQPQMSLRFKEIFLYTRIMNTWNSLPESVISASTTESVKNKLDKFWSNQDLIFDYSAELTGIGSRSFIFNNFD